MAVQRITNGQLAQFALDAVAKGAKYWYGTCWYKCTESLLSRKTAQYPAHFTSSRKPTYRKHIAAGLMCADCVGLIKGAAWTVCGTEANVYASNGCPDTNANGMLALCKSKGMENGKIGSLPDIPGLLLHKDGHVGITVGGGYAVEASGFNAGIVKTKISGRGWVSWAKLPFVAYENSAIEQPKRKLGDRTLRNGCEGDDVEELQQVLIALGFDCGKWGADGEFGDATQAAVRAFQRANYIGVDGVFGPVSYATLLNVQRGILTPEPGEEGSPDDGESDGDMPGEQLYTVILRGITAGDATVLYEMFPNVALEMEEV